MKKIFLITVNFVFTCAAMSQTTAEKKDLHNDLIKERNKRHEVAKDLVNGYMQAAKADHKAAVAYHKDIHRDVNNMQVQGPPLPPHPKHHLPHPPRPRHKHHRRRHL